MPEHQPTPEEHGPFDDIAQKIVDGSISFQGEITSLDNPAFFRGLQSASHRVFRDEEQGGRSLRLIDADLELSKAVERLQNGGQ